MFDGLYYVKSKSSHIIGKLFHVALNVALIELIDVDSRQIDRVKMVLESLYSKTFINI